jgi:hypothetical protein
MNSLLVGRYVKVKPQAELTYVTGEGWVEGAEFGEMPRKRWPHVEGAAPFDRFVRDTRYQVAFHNENYVIVLDDNGDLWPIEAARVQVQPEESND